MAARESASLYGATSRARLESAARPARTSPPSVASSAREQAASTRTEPDTTAVSFRLPPRYTGQRVGQRLTLDELERGAEVRHGQLRISVPLPSATSAAARCTSTVTSGETWYRPLRLPAGNSGWPSSSVPIARRAACATLNRVLRRRVGVGRPEDTGPQTVARDDVGVVQRQVRDELDGATHAVWRQLLFEAVQAWRRRKQADVYRTGSEQPSLHFAADGEVEGRG